MKTERTEPRGFELRRIAYGSYAKAIVSMKEGLPCAREYAVEALGLYERLSVLDENELRICRELREIIDR